MVRAREFTRLARGDTGVFPPLAYRSRRRPASRSRTRRRRQSRSVSAPPSSIRCCRRRARRSCARPGPARRRPCRTAGTRRWPGEDRRGHRLEEAHAPDRAVAAAPLAAPPLPRRIAKLLEQHREAPFQHLGVGEARVGHVRVHATSVPSKPFARARAAADGFVILVAVVAEGEVVHRALRGAHHAERAVERVGDALRGLDIARDHRRRIARVAASSPRE